MTEAEGQEPAPARPDRRGWRARLLRAAACLLLLSGAAEVGLRVLAPDSSPYGAMYLPDPDCEYVLNPDYRDPAHGVSFNAQGLRDVERPLEKPAGVRRVLVLGDSFIYGSGPLEEGLSRQLSGLLGERFDVINAGVPGWSTPNEAAWLRKFGLAYAPDAVVVAHFVGNDVWEATGREVEVVDGELVEAGDRDGDTRLRRARNASRLYRFLKRLPEQAWLGLWGDTIERRRYHKTEYRRMGMFARGDTAASWEPGWEMVTAKLEEIRRLVAPRPVVVLVIPDEFQVDATLRQEVLERYGDDEVRYDWDSPQRRLAELCQRLGLERVDVLEEFRARTLAGERLYKPLDSHWSAAGNRLAAERLAQTAALRALR